jgi:phenylpyruvate tautomerase PptA (4-oxalocrotonate tautomerase family)
MPLLIQVTEGLLTAEGARRILPDMAAALLKVHGLTGNSFMTPLVIGHLDVYPESHCYVGGQSQSLAVIEVKIPSITFPEQSVKDAFVQEATDIVHALRAGSHPKERTFVNVVYAVDGTWGIGGQAFTNAALGAAIQASA